MAYTEVKVSLTSSDILALGTTPFQLVAAPGTGKAIVPISVTFYLHYGTTPYATNTKMQIYEQNVFQPVYPDIENVLNFNNDHIILAYPASTNSGTVRHQLWEDEALMLRVIGGNPTAGDSTIDVITTYDDITL